MWSDSGDSLSLLDTGGPRQTVSAPRRRRQSGACSPRLALGPPTVEPHSHGLLDTEVVMSLCLRISVGTTKKAMKNVFTQTFRHFEETIGGCRNHQHGDIHRHPHDLQVQPPQPAMSADHKSVTSRGWLKITLSERTSRVTSGHFLWRPAVLITTAGSRLGLKLCCCKQNKGQQTEEGGADLSSVGQTRQPPTYQRGQSHKHLSDVIKMRPSLQ